MRFSIEPLKKYALSLAMASMTMPSFIPEVLACAYCQPAEKALKTNNYGRMQALVNQASRAGAMCVKMRAIKAKCLHLQNKNYAALDEINRALKSNPGDAGFWMTRAEIHDSLKNPKAVLEDATNAIKIDSKLSRAYLLRARAYYTLTFFMLAKDPTYREKGLRDLGTAIQLNPRDPDGYQYKGVWLMANKHYDEAAMVLSKGLSFSPHNDKLLMYRAMSLSESGQIEQAIKDFSQLIELDRKQPASWKKRGNLYAQQNRFEEAYADYNMAAELAPKDYRLKYRRAEVAVKLKKYPRAISDYKEIIARNPLDDDAVKKLGDVYMISGNLVEAIKAYSEAIELSPEISSYYLARSAAYLKSGKPALSKKDRDKARRIKNQPAVRKI